MKFKRLIFCAMIASVASVAQSTETSVKARDFRDSVQAKLKSIEANALAAYPEYTDVRSTLGQIAQVQASFEILRSEVKTQIATADLASAEKRAVTKKALDGCKTQDCAFTSFAGAFGGVIESRNFRRALGDIKRSEGVIARAMALALGRSAIRQTLTELEARGIITGAKITDSQAGNFSIPWNLDNYPKEIYDYNGAPEDTLWGKQQTINISYVNSANQYVQTAVIVYSYLRDLNEVKGFVSEGGSLAGARMPELANAILDGRSVNAGNGRILYAAFAIKP